MEFAANWIKAQTEPAGNQPILLHLILGSAHRRSIWRTQNIEIGSLRAGVDQTRTQSRARSASVPSIQINCGTQVCVNDSPPTCL